MVKVLMENLKVDCKVLTIDTELRTHPIQFNSLLSFATLEKAKNKRIQSMVQGKMKTKRNRKLSQTLRASGSPRKSNASPAKILQCPPDPTDRPTKDLTTTNTHQGPQRSRLPSAHQPQPRPKAKPANTTHTGTIECISLRVPPPTNGQNQPTHSSPKTQGSPMPTRSDRGLKLAIHKTQQAPNSPSPQKKTQLAQTTRANPKPQERAQPPVRKRTVSMTYNSRDIFI